MRVLFWLRVVEVLLVPGGSVAVGLRWYKLAEACRAEEIVVV